MKNTLLGFLLAVVLIIGTATTTVQIMTVKPAKPIHTIIIEPHYMRYKKDIKIYADKGYQVTHIIRRTEGHYTIIMSKY